jgi:hypothetical protein
VSGDDDQPTLFDGFESEEEGSGPHTDPWQRDVTITWEGGVRILSSFGAPVDKVLAALRNARLLDGRAPLTGSRVPVGKQHPGTSQAMARRMLREGTLRRDIVMAVREHGGLTDDDLERVLNRSHQSASGGRNALVRDGWLRDSGRTRVNRWGNEAIVWEYVPEGSDTGG